MKSFFPLLSFGAVSLLIIMGGCNKTDTALEDPSLDVFENEITVRSPEPVNELWEIELTKSQENMVSGLNRFAISLLDALNVEAAKSSKQSFVFSPLSVALDLAMTANGVKGQAREELFDALRYTEDNVSEYNAFCKSMIEGLPAVDLTSKVKLANAVITDFSYPVNDNFKTIIEDNYYSLTESLPFNKWELVKTRINKWVNDNTEGLIPAIVGGDRSDAVAFLLNTLYFKASLREPFLVKNTTKKTFHAYSRDLPLDFMYGVFDLPYYSNDYLSSIRIPLGRHSNFDMSILLPNDKGNLSSVFNTLKTDYSEYSKDFPLKSVKVTVPKIKTSSSFGLIPILKELGINSIFNPCDFSAMLKTPVPLLISSVLHDAVFSFDENGVEAAAVTAMGASGTSSGQEPDLEEKTFFADRPFVYLVREKSSGVILFAGVFSGK